MSRVKFFILSVLIFSLSSLTISAKVISYCLDKKYSQLNETNHVILNQMMLMTYALIVNVIILK